MEKATLKGNIQHSACRWCYGSIPLEELCAAAKNIGLVGIDLVGPKEWPVLQQYGLISTMCNGAEINLVDGWNDKKFHPKLIQNYTEMIPLVAKILEVMDERGLIDMPPPTNDPAAGEPQVFTGDVPLPRPRPASLGEPELSSVNVGAPLSLAPPTAPADCRLLFKVISAPFNDRRFQHPISLIPVSSKSTSSPIATHTIPIS